MKYGPGRFDAEVGAQVHIRASGSFIVFAVGQSGQRLRILGPNNASKRSFVFLVPRCEEVEVETENDTVWEYEVKTVPDRRERPNQTPVEIPVGVIQPESLESIMARMINERFSQMAEERGMETFEEADDFDIDDELPKTPYEMQDLNPEEPFYSAEEIGFNNGSSKGEPKNDTLKRHASDAGAQGNREAGDAGEGAGRGEAEQGKGNQASS